MSSYESLNVRRVINAAAAQTMLGGSLMPEPVLDAMRDAAQSYVSIPELHDRVGERLATITRNEAACLSAGAAAGILMATAACMTYQNLDHVTALPNTTGLQRTEVLVFRSHRNGFLSAVRETGAAVTEIGGDEAALETALSDRTAAVMWFAGGFWGSDELPLDVTIRIAHEAGVPVVVDAADQIPPVSRLWEYTTEQYADLAIFSGGKGLRGPQSSGLIVGRADLICACRANTGPMHSIARPAKVGKEEMIGLLAAVEWSLAQDVEEVSHRYNGVVNRWLEGFRNLPAISLTRVTMSHSGQPIPRAIIEIESATLRDAILANLWEMDPRVSVLPEGDRSIALNPQGVADDDVDLVVSSVTQALLA